MAERPNRKINLYFFQLNPETESSDTAENRENIQAISKMFEKLPSNFHPIELQDHKVNLYGTIEKHGQFYLGTFLKNQTANIPPSYDEQQQMLSKLPLSDGQGLAYQTSFLYDPSVRIVMIEAVRNGVSIGTMCAFLNKNFDIPALEPSLVINPAKLAQFNDMSMFSRFQVKIAKLESGTIFQSKKRTALGQIIHSADDTNTDLLEYTIGVRKMSASLKQSRIRTLVKALLKYDDTEEVKTLIVKGREDEDSSPDTINFIEQKLQDFITVKRERLIETFEIQERYSKLLDVYNNHKGSLSIYKVKRST